VFSLGSLYSDHDYKSNNNIIQAFPKTRNVYIDYIIID